jgi:hypothetical protein
LSFLAFPGFSGGVFVAAGNLSGNGYADIVVSADAGAGPHVKVFSGRDGSLLMSFYAYDPAFKGGVRVAVADVNGDGYADIITAPGAGAPGGNVKVFSGKDGSLLESFLAFSPSFTGGVFIAAGDVYSAGSASIIVGAGAGAPGGHVEVFNGQDLTLEESFFAFDQGFIGGVRVGTGEVNGVTAVVAGSGPGARGNLKAFGPNGELLLSTLDSSSDVGGIYVS